MKNIYPFVALFLLTILVSCGSDDSPTAVDDTQSPTDPLNLIASNITETGATLSWDGATDNIGVANYQLYENGVLSETGIAETSFSVSGLLEETEYNFYVTAVDAAGNESNSSNTNSFFTLSTALTFEMNLSDMGIFTGALSNLTPAARVQLYEINSTLFTDYAKKQRLVRLPNGQKMEYNNSDQLPNFPDNTLIAKTFYYNLDESNPDAGTKIIETRVFIKVNGVWLPGTYVWNEAQTEGTFTENGSIEDVDYIDINGVARNINYVIPAQADCFTCHNNNNVTLPIGMKLRSMNFTPSNGNMNQLEHFGSLGILDGVTPSDISLLPDWTDASLDILDRGRAYIDINCAHCHQPGGEVTNFDLDFRLETIFEDTGIYANRGEIEERTQSNLATYRMPQIGRSIVHDEAVAMLLEYLEAIE